MESRRRKNREAFLEETIDSRKEARSTLDKLPLNPDLCATCQTINFNALLLDTSGSSLHRFKHETIYLGTLGDICHQVLKGCAFCADSAFLMVHEAVHDALSTRSPSVSEPSMEPVFVALVVQNNRFSYPSVAVSHCSKGFYLGIDIRFERIRRNSPLLWGHWFGGTTTIIW
ncbi:hypothetical protein BJY04DRAFT_223112 [Aspergillus karnatakaensis]|uniref:uncharacterized protein n=1 Tax=Aspergillus karnatakaensis TaxID=1810916 RepID=UPI003CCD950C